MLLEVQQVHANNTKKKKQSCITMNTSLSIIKTGQKCHLTLWGMKQSASHLLMEKVISALDRMENFFCSFFLLLNSNLENVLLVLLFEMFFRGKGSFSWDRGWLQQVP